MAFNQATLPEAAQKQLSKIIKDIQYHETVIEKCEIIARESPSDVVKRARAGVIYHEKQIREHNTIVEQRIEREINKIKVEAQRDYENKLKYLKDAEDKLETAENDKSRQQVTSELSLKKLNEDREKLLSMFRQPVSQFTQPPLPPLRKMEEAVPKPQEIDFDFGEEGMNEEEEIRKRRIMLL